MESWGTLHCCVVPVSRLFMDVSGQQWNLGACCTVVLYQ